MRHIIVPLDGSELAERVLPFAANLAEVTGSDMKLVQAPINPASLEPGVDVDSIVDGARQYLEERANELRKGGRTISAHVTVAPPAQLVLEEANEPEVSAIVMSTHGRSGLMRLLLGSVAEEAVRHSPVPVYLLPSAAGQLYRPKLRRILVPLDGSDLAYSAMAPVTELARQTGVEITLLRVFDPSEPARSLAPEYFRPIKARLRAQGLSVNSEWRFGQPAMEILLVAERLGVDLIALATHGRAGLDRLRYGSVAEAVLRQSITPLMTFGPEAIQRLRTDVHTLTTSSEILAEA